MKICAMKLIQNGAEWLMVTATFVSLIESLCIHAIYTSVGCSISLRFHLQRKLSMTPLSSMAHSAFLIIGLMPVTQRRQWRMSPEIDRIITMGDLRQSYQAEIDARINSTKCPAHNFLCVHSMDFSRIHTYSNQPYTRWMPSRNCGPTTKIIITIIVNVNNDWKKHIVHATNKKN